MNIARLLGAFLIAGTFAAGCGSVAHIEKDESVNFDQFRSFSWIDTQEDSLQKLDDIQERKVQNAVSAELEKAGWRKTEKNPDVLLSYDVLFEKNLKQSSNPVYSQPYTRTFFNPYTRRWSTIYYPSRFVGYDEEQYEVREGTITISMIDAKTDRTVWQGWTKEEVDSRNLTSKEIESSVKSIFRKFDLAKN
jgi:hypothetical protein